MYLGGYIRKACESLGAVLWVFRAEHSGNFQKDHQCSVVAITVTLMEQEYIPEEKCALFIHLHVPGLAWTPLVSVG